MKRFRDIIFTNFILLTSLLLTSTIAISSSTEAVIPVLQFLLNDDEPTAFNWPPTHTTQGHGQCEVSQAQDAGCTFLITTSTFSDRVLIKSDRTLTPLNGNPDRIAGPGDTVCIAPGYYGGTIINQIAGTEDLPIKITNCGGQVVFRDEVPINSSRHIKLLGNGHSDTLYGLKIMGTVEEEAEFIDTYGVGFQTNSQPALDIGSKSRDIEIAWMEISNPIGARAPNIHFVTKTLTGTDGSYIKQYDLEHTDQIFVQTGTHIHHNFIHHSLEAEGLYVGKFGCDQDLFDSGLALENTRIYDNIVTNNGGDGIQVGCSRKDTYIYDNYVYDFGYNPFNNNGHTKGIQLGKGTTAHVYSNYLDNGASDCVWAAGGPSDDDSDVGLLIYNNVFKNCEQAIGIAQDANSIVEADQSIELYNNTILGIRNAHYYVALSIYNDIKINTINNLYVDSVAGLSRFAQGSVPSSFTESHQFVSADSGELHFVDYELGNFNLTRESPVIDSGSQIPQIQTDLTGRRRIDSHNDIGAFEYGADRR